MVSHIDDDHINGMLELTKELVAAKDARQPLPLRILSFWHNTFDDIIGNDPSKLTSAVTASFGAASLSGDPDTEGLDPAAAQVLASIDQGFRLRDDARKLSLRINPQFGGKLIMAAKGSKSVDLDKGLKMTVAGPMKAELAALQKAHDAFLKRKAEKEKEALAAFTDTSVPNLSSLVLIAEAGKKRILLTGDARGDKILDGLELIGALKKNGSMHVEILKMPHHGSDRNIDRVFFERITADHYVLSGDGEHGNPERETFEMLLAERSVNDDFTMHLTYPIEEIDRGREADWNKEQAKEKTRKKKNPNTRVRENWSAKKHSLDALFAANKKFAKKLRFVQADGPHVIDLLDKVGF
jgi:hypothetical protein